MVVFKKLSLSEKSNKEVYVITQCQQLKFTLNLDSQQTVENRSSETIEIIVLNKTAHLILFLCLIQLVEIRVGCELRSARDVEDSDTNLAATSVEAGDNSEVNNIGQIIEDKTEDTSIKI
ncbi:unnamed protein product [Parnassius apollo]|uniref:(apollo) hypothetical protein n=1 Tax=Parnassius apollo TaxID=110799 RepID=A0A8S3XZH1_PARAO|nr:unnamed protein product [Parnassius apollo]